MLGHFSDTSPSEPGGRASSSTNLTTLGGRDRRFQNPLGYRDKPMLSSQLSLGDRGEGVMLWRRSISSVVPQRYTPQAQMKVIAPFTDTER